MFYANLGTTGKKHSNTYRTTSANTHYRTLDMYTTNFIT